MAQYPTTIIIHNIIEELLLKNNLKLKIKTSDEEKNKFVLCFCISYYYHFR